MQALLNQLDARQLKLMGGCAVVLLIAAFVMYGIWPSVNELQALRENRAVLTQVNAAPQGADGEITRLRTELEDLRKRLQGDMANLPLRQMESFIIGRLQGISWRNHIDLLSVNPGMGGRVQVFEEVLFNVRVSGDYFDLYQWLQEVREELGYVVVKQFNITPGASTDKSDRLTATFTIVSYREAEHA